MNPKDMFRLDGKVALITGAGGGIGSGITVGIAAAGARVALSGTNRAKLESVLEDVRAAGGDGWIVEANLSSLEDARRLVKTVAEEGSRLDILINNAGVNRRMPATQFTEDDYDFIMNVNLKACFFLCQEAHAHMVAAGGGKILNIGSMTSFVGIGNVAIYGMTKAALAQLTMTLAVEWARDNIQVNCLAPGFIKTPLTAQGQWADPHISQWILQRVPARRPGTPEDMVGTAVWLASPASDFVTGQVIAVDGGFLAGASWTKDE